MIEAIKNLFRPTYRVVFRRELWCVDKKVWWWPFWIKQSYHGLRCRAVEAAQDALVPPEYLR